MNCRVGYNPPPLTNTHTISSLPSQLSDLNVSHLESLHHQREQLEAQVSHLHQTTEQDSMADSCSKLNPTCNYCFMFPAVKFQT